MPWLVLVLGVLSLWPFVRVELGIEEPLIDVRLLATSAQWPVQLTAFLFGMSVLGAQIPLSTFARTDPEVAGYGLGASAGQIQTVSFGEELPANSGSGEAAWAKNRRAEFGVVQ